MTLSVRERVALLQDSGLGLSIEAMAAIIGVDVADVDAVQTSPTANPASPGGSDIKSALLTQAAAPAVNGVRWLGGDGLGIGWDDIGVAPSTLGGIPVLQLPKGYYDGMLSHGTVEDLASGDWLLQATVAQVGRRLDSQVIPPPVGSVVYSGDTFPATATLSVSFACESGDEDLSPYGLPGYFLALFAACSATDIAASPRDVSTVTPTMGFYLYLRQIAAKA